MKRPHLSQEYSVVATAMLAGAIICGYVGYARLPKVSPAPTAQTVVANKKLANEYLKLAEELGAPYQVSYPAEYPLALRPARHDVELLLWRKDQKACLPAGVTTTNGLYAVLDKYSSVYTAECLNQAAIKLQRDLPALTADYAVSADKARNARILLITLLSTIGAGAFGGVACVANIRRRTHARLAASEQARL
jgi:hypothetical protein